MAGRCQLTCPPGPAPCGIPPPPSAWIGRPPSRPVMAGRWAPSGVPPAERLRAGPPPGSGSNVQLQHLDRRPGRLQMPQVGGLKGPFHRSQFSYRHPFAFSKFTAPPGSEAGRESGCRSRHGCSPSRMRQFKRSPAVIGEGALRSGAIRYQRCPPRQLKPCV